MNIEMVSVMFMTITHTFKYIVTMRKCGLCAGVTFSTERCLSPTLFHVRNFTRMTNATNKKHTARLEARNKEILFRQPIDAAPHNNQEVIVCENIVCHLLVPLFALVV